MHERVELDDLQLAGAPGMDSAVVDVLALDDALARLAQLDAVKAELVKLRYFAGLTSDQAAEVLGLSPATADRYWAFARAWLFRELGGR
jgi:DNA-directed RNA polymerase specialized sigma24 family protein